MIIFIATSISAFNSSTSYELYSLKTISQMLHVLWEKLINFSTYIKPFDDSLHFNPDTKLDERLTNTAHNVYYLKAT